ncbi:bifunctional glycosyltransferase 87/phosphatase PAP2 family protein [Streptomyces sp. NPDC101132]|uniref:bifunctional glycosyltransferase 87/phosphatase PAP2 family protein n=1 Tax=Streptomyces sp. NPDC101132 TaxID=3366110 RepID=UPI00380F28DA
MADAADHNAVNGPAAAAALGADPRLTAARAVLWLLAALLAVRQAASALRLPPGRRLADPDTWIGENGVLHVSGSLYDAVDGPRFTGTPFSGLVLRPLTSSAQQALGVAWTFGTLLLVAAVGLVAARSLPGPVSRRTALLAAPVAIALTMISLPVRGTFTLGQTSIIPVLLVLSGCLRVPGERTSGLLVGLGAALQPALLLFVPLLWFTGRRTAARATAVTFAAGSALAWAALPRDSWTYWVHHLAGTGLGDRADSPANQSLHGALLRLGLSGPLETGVLCLLAAAVCLLGLRRAVRYAHDGQPLLAVALTGCVAVAVSPGGWQHQLLWVLLAAAGKVGTRAADRPVWPVTVVLVMTLPSDVLLPNLALLAPVRDNVLLLAALAAACAVPFLPRTSPHWHHPVPTAYARPAPARWSRIPLLPFWRRVLSRPNLLLELLLIRVGYSLYSHIRAAAPDSRALAEGHGRRIHSLEGRLGIDIEHAVNHAVVDQPWLRGFFDFYYTSFHFVVPLAILALLYRRSPGDYRWARASLGLATVLALAGFWLYPLAPPRLMPGLGFIDTVHGPQDLADPQYGAMTAISNQYAAMPSLHFGWALWCGLVVLALARRPWQQALGLVHPAVTLCAIVSTANHWVLDAVGGAAVVAAGFGLVYVLSGPRGTGPAPAPPAGDVRASVPPALRGRRSGASIGS